MSKINKPSIGKQGVSKALPYMKLVCMLYGLNIKNVHHWNIAREYIEIQMN